MAELGAGEGCCGKEDKRDESLSKMAVEVFAKLKVCGLLEHSRAAGRAGPLAEVGGAMRTARISGPGCVLCSAIGDALWGVRICSLGGSGP